MPTARELLEQADALMRRNRSVDDIPVLTDAVPPGKETRSPFAPANAAPPAAPVPVAKPDVEDDVPLLTDEVEEIEAAALDPEVGEGEPSAWLDLEQGEPSVIGDAPDSIAIVPPVDLRRPAPAPEVEEFDELDDELAAAIAAAPREEETLQPPIAARSPAEMPVAHVRQSQPAPEVIAGGAASLLHGDLPVAPPVIAPVEVDPAPQHVAPVAEVPLAPALMDSAEVAASPSPSESAPVAVPPTPAAPDAAHWEAMAEEIRMQVLQRIDLFTDTGLRTQLGERLQPIVDRASADLVATINQHVGELLRAYVAEAIEREIDSWRRNH